MQPVREAVSYRGLFTAGWFGVREKHCSRLEIYDRLRASEQAITRFRILEHILSNASVVERPMAVGRPRYFSLSAFFSIFRYLNTSFLSSSLQFELKKIADLSRFTI